MQQRQGTRKGSDGDGGLTESEFQRLLHDVVMQVEAFTQVCTRQYYVAVCIASGLWMIS